MSKIRKFHLLTGDKIVGKFILKNEVECIVTLHDGLEFIDIPYDFYPDYLKGIRRFTGEQVDYWIRTRILPAGRHNIHEFLVCAGLEEYDPLKIFLFLNGEYTQDNHRIQEIIN